MPPGLHGVIFGTRRELGVFTLKNTHTTRGKNAYCRANKQEPPLGTSLSPPSTIRVRLLSIYHSRTGARPIEPRAGSRSMPAPRPTLRTRFARSVNSIGERPTICEVQRRAAPMRGGSGVVSPSADAAGCAAMELSRATFRNCLIPRAFARYVLFLLKSRRPCWLDPGLAPSVAGPSICL
jgi:hypothetical protein